VSCVFHGGSGSDLKDAPELGAEGWVLGWDDEEWLSMGKYMGLYIYMVIISNYIYL
jgi:hypothetical protein